MTRRISLIIYRKVLLNTILISSLVGFSIFSRRILNCKSACYACSHSSVWTCAHDSMRSCGPTGWAEVFRDESSSSGFSTAWADSLSHPVEFSVVGVDRLDRVLKVHDLPHSIH